MAYTKTEWENAPSTRTPVNRGNMNHIENGIYDNSINIGELTNLNTTTKSSLVAAINEVADINSKLCDYSTTETNTGKKWIDGKPIYRIVIEETGLTTDTEYIKSFSNYGISNVNSSTIVKLEGYEYSDTLFLPMSEYSGFTNYLYISSSTDIKFKPGFTTSVRIIMEYTKTSD